MNIQNLCAMIIFNRLHILQSLFIVIIMYYYYFVVLWTMDIFLLSAASINCIIWFKPCGRNKFRVQSIISKTKKKPFSAFILDGQCFWMRNHIRICSRIKNIWLKFHIFFKWQNELIINFRWFSTNWTFIWLLIRDTLGFFTNAFDKVKWLILEPL